jgi:hypothetical protein
VARRTARKKLIRHNVVVLTSSLGEREIRGGRRLQELLERPREPMRGDVVGRRQVADPRRRLPLKTAADDRRKL